MLNPLPSLFCCCSPSLSHSLSAASCRFLARVLPISLLYFLAWLSVYFSIHRLTLLPLLSCISISRVLSLTTMQPFHRCYYSPYVWQASSLHCLCKQDVGGTYSCGYM